MDKKISKLGEARNKTSSASHKKTNKGSAHDRPAEYRWAGHSRFSVIQGPEYKKIQVHLDHWDNLTPRRRYELSF